MSKLEEIVPAEELNLPPSPGFGKYKKIMPREAVAHPAKFNTNLVEFLIERYTKPGDVVLDPMAGSGVLGVIAALKGRNAVQVELEEKFFEWMEKARENVEKYPTLSEKGLIINICGDARRLSDLIRQADVCITSPPYESSFEGGSRHTGGILEREKRQDGETVLRIGVGVKYSDDKKNIGNLSSSKEEYESLEKGLPLKNCAEVDMIITSPPYADALSIKADPEGERRRLLEKFRRGEVEGGDAEWVVWRYLESTPNVKYDRQYSERRENIGNLPLGSLDDGKRETYLSAMLRVYREMWKVLKDGGRAIIVVKPFIRKREVIDLPRYTWLLLERVGFKLEKVYKLRLKTQSFWRIIYYEKNPHVPRLTHEYIIVARKIGSSNPTDLVREN